MDGPASGACRGPARCPPSSAGHLRCLLDPRAPEACGRRPGQLGKAEGSHRAVALLGQVGQVSGHQGWRGWRGDHAAGVAPGLEVATGGVVEGPGVFGDAVVEGVADSLYVCGRKAGARRRRERFVRFLVDCQEGILQGHAVFS